MVFAQAGLAHTAGGQVLFDTAMVLSLVPADASEYRCSPSQHVLAVVIKITYA